MTDRYNAIIVVLDRDIRDDDAEPLLNAIRMMRGVASVEPQVSGYSADYAARRRLALELEAKISALIADILKG